MTTQVPSPRLQLGHRGEGRPCGHEQQRQQWPSPHHGTCQAGPLQLMSPGLWVMPIQVLVTVPMGLGIEDRLQPHSPSWERCGKEGDTCWEPPCPCCQHTKHRSSSPLAVPGKEPPPQAPRRGNCRLLHCSVVKYGSLLFRQAFTIMQTQIISLLHHAPLFTRWEPWQVTAVAEDTMCTVSQPWQRMQHALCHSRGRGTRDKSCATKG